MSLAKCVTYVLTAPRNSRSAIANAGAGAEADLALIALAVAISEVTSFNDVSSAGRTRIVGQD
jgi:hypothetical protein